MKEITINLSERTIRELTAIGKAIIDANIEIESDGMLSDETFKVLELLGISTDGDGFSKFWLTEAV